MLIFKGCEQCIEWSYISYVLVYMFYENHIIEQNISDYYNAHHSSVSIVLNSSDWT